MSEQAAAAFEIYRPSIGESEGVGDWFEVTQELVDRFADVTHDHQFIHIDPVRAAETPFGGTIAHGFLTLSLLTHLVGSVPPGDRARFTGMVMGINYGFDKVRFVSPVRVGRRIRAEVVLADAQLKGSQIQVTRGCSVAIEGEDKPALVADWITRSVYG